MEQATHEICSENPSLLTLNDDCLLEVFTFLKLDDFVHLAVTCTRLLCVAQQRKKYKNIVVERYDGGSSYTVEHFAKILAVIGVNVASVAVGRETFAILKTIADTKPGITELDSYYTGQIDGQSESCKSKSLQGLLPFRNLKKLMFWYCNDFSTDDWRKCFETNRRIESLEYWDYGRNKCLPLLQMLSELKSLTIHGLELKPEEFHHLSGLTSLTKLSFVKADVCYNQLLIELAQKLNLVELEFRMPCDADTFAVVKSFRHLEVLSMAAGYSNLRSDLDRVPENAMFPTMLKKIKLNGFRISCSNFLSIVKQLSLLEVFGIRCGEIFWDNDEAECFPTRRYGAADIQGSKIISRIAKELRVEKRNLKIILNDFKDETVCKYSDNLEIIKRRWVREKTFDHTFRLQ